MFPYLQKGDLSVGYKDHENLLFVGHGAPLDMNAFERWGWKRKGVWIMIHFVDDFLDYGIEQRFRLMELLVGHLAVYGNFKLQWYNDSLLTADFSEIDSKWRQEIEVLGSDAEKDARLGDLVQAGLKEECLVDVIKFMAYSEEFESSFFRDK
jgi:hypothetical protein